MKNSKKFKGISLLMLISTIAFGQQYYEKKQVAPSAPNTAALEKFTDYPVSLYTAVPEIGVPIHTISLKSLSVPISFSYHSSGVKVDETASNVGMGWSLNGGGAISIQVNGILDEISGFGNQHPQFNKVKNLSLQTYYPGEAWPCLTVLASEDIFYLYYGGDVEYLRNIHYQTDDSEPDQYSFSFNGRGGKFFQDENGNFQTIPKSKLKIERSFSGGNLLGYKFTDEDGTIYEFYKLEETTLNSGNWCTPNAPLNTTEGRSYHLTRIVTALGEVVNYYYSTNNYQQVNQYQFSRARYLNSGCYQYNTNGNLAYNCTTGGNLLVGSWKVDSIIASEGSRVLFSYSTQDRTDLPGTKAMTGVQVKSGYTGETLKSFTLNQDYSAAKLRLTSLQEAGKPAYQFQYNPGGAPRLSYSQDHWGYFNGANNSTLLPKDEYNGFPEGADREPHPENVQAGILNKITYPTGGYTEYFYELNEFYVSIPTTKHVKITGASLASVANQTVSYSFTVPSNSSKHYIIHNNSDDGTQTWNDYCHIDLTGPNGYFQRFWGNNTHKELTLTPGNYTLSIETVGTTYSGDAIVQWFNEEIVPPHNEKGGGIRVKEIKAYDALTSTVYTKKFEYSIPGTSNSSGKAMYFPQYLESRVETRFLPPASCYSQPGTNTCNMMTQNSNSITPVSFSNGYHVGYSEVTVYVKSKTENGYTHYKYLINNSNSLGGGIPGVPYPPIIVYDWMNGNLMEQTDFKYTGPAFEPVRKKKNYYNYTLFDKDALPPYTDVTYGARIGIIQGPRISGICSMCNNALTDVTGPLEFGAQRYQLFSSWHYLTKEEETLYQGNNSITTKVEYFYDNPSHLRPTRIVRTDSKGEKNITTVKYPLDYVGLTSGDPLSQGINNLKMKNVISAEVERTNSKSDAAGFNTRVTRSALTVYHPTFPLPQAVKGFETNVPVTNFQPSGVSGGTVSFDSRYKDQGSFTYSSQGNIIEMQKSNDIVESVIWGYNYNYPVAKIIGKGYNDAVAQSGINMGVVNNPSSEALLRTELNKLRLLSGAMVNTYTYRPLVGVSSEADPRGRLNYYEYDNLNRLTLVRDHENKILKKICYSYAGQQENCGSGGGGCTNTIPEWQNIPGQIRCQLDGNGQNTGYQEQQQQDVNACSGSFGQTQWVSIGYNTSACPPPVNVTITCRNYVGLTGYTAVYTNSSTQQSYSFNILGVTSWQTLGTIPAGNYTLTISRNGFSPWLQFGSGCSGMYLEGTSATFYNINVSASDCNAITLIGIE